MRSITRIVKFALIFAASWQLLACGGGGGGGSAIPVPIPVVSSLAFFAGNISGPRDTDGTGALAGFDSPSGIAADSTGNVYVADTFNHTIRKISPTGVASTFAGKAGSKGSTDGAGAIARFNSPQGVALDTEGNIYVADSDNQTIRKITSTGLVSTLAGTVGITGSADLIGTAASFNRPTGIAVDSDHNVYLTDSGNNTIRRIAALGAQVTTFAGSAGVVAGSADGTGLAARFDNPAGIAINSTGVVYVADANNSSIRQITPDGQVSTFAGTSGTLGGVDGNGLAARFYYPFGIAIDSLGNVYVADTSNNTIRKITPAADVSTVAGAAEVAGSADGIGSAARFNNPYALAAGSAGNVYVADTRNNTIRKIVSAAGVNTVTTLAGTAGVTGSANGSGASASFNYPYGITSDSAGNVYVADTFNNTIRKVTPVGAVSTLAGTAGVTGSANGSGVAASFNNPYGIASDSAGNLYVADSMNSMIRKISAAGDVTTFAVAGANFASPQGIATDSAGNVYVADVGYNTILRITPAGVVSTLAGTAGVIGSANGNGAAASFNNPYGIASDSAGNLYVADAGNNIIRKITPTGVVSTLAGTAGVSGSADGTAAAASFNNPSAVAVDAAGNVYVADTGNRTVRKITPAGLVSTVVGTAGQRGFAAGALPGMLANPTALAISGTSLYIIVNNGLVMVQNVP